jgi:hypothetical protein
MRALYFRLFYVSVAIGLGTASQNSGAQRSGNQAEPVITISGENFDQVHVGGIATRSFTVRNSGTGAALWENPQNRARQALNTDGSLNAPFRFETSGTFPGSGGNCGQSDLAVGSSCTISVSMDASRTGTFADTLVIRYLDPNMGEHSVNLQLSAIVANQQVAFFTVIGEEFGSLPVGTWITKEFTIKNNGTGQGTFTVGQQVFKGAASPLNGGLDSRFRFSYDEGFPGRGGTCNNFNVMAVDETCTIIVSFDSSAAGEFSDTMTLPYRDNFGVRSLVHTFSADVAGANLTFDNPATDSNEGARFDFGLAPLTGTRHLRWLRSSIVNGKCMLSENASDVESRDMEMSFYSPRVITVYNTGRGAAQSLSWAGTDLFYFAGGSFPGNVICPAAGEMELGQRCFNNRGTCTSSLAANASCTLIVAFAPTELNPQRPTSNANLVLSYSGGSAPNVTLPISGYINAAVEQALTDLYLDVEERTCFIFEYYKAQTQFRQATDEQIEAHIDQLVNFAEPYIRLSGNRTYLTGILTDSQYTATQEFMNLLGRRTNIEHDGTGTPVGAIDVHDQRVTYPIDGIPAITATCGGIEPVYAAPAGFNINDLRAVDGGAAIPQFDPRVITWEHGASCTTTGS